MLCAQSSGEHFGHAQAHEAQVRLYDFFVLFPAKLGEVLLIAADRLGAEPRSLAKLEIEVDQVVPASLLGLRAHGRWIGPVTPAIRRDGDERIVFSGAFRTHLASDHFRHRRGHEVGQLLFRFQAGGRRAGPAQSGLQEKAHARRAIAAVIARIGGGYPCRCAGSPSSLARTRFQTTQDGFDIFHRIGDETRLEINGQQRLSVVAAVQAG